MKNRLVVAALLCGAWMAVGAGCGDGSSSKRAPRFAVFVVSNVESETYSTVRTAPDGRPIFTSSDPILTEDEVARLHFGEFAGAYPILTLDLTDAGTRRLTDRTEEYVDQELAILWDSQVVSVPRIKNALSDQIAIVSSESLPATTLESIAEYLNKRQLAAQTP